jgi:transposase
MISPDNVQVYIGIGAVDMRKSINGLSLLVSQQWSLDVFTGHMFAFTNRRRTTVKVLYWDLTGFALWQKRLDKERFTWPKTLCVSPSASFAGFLKGSTSPPTEAIWR